MCFCQKNQKLAPIKLPSFSDSLKLEEAKKMLEEIVPSIHGCVDDALEFAGLMMLTLIQSIISKDRLIFSGFTAEIFSIPIKQTIFI